MLDSHEEVRHFSGSRRDQEEGSGAGPSSYPRRDHEQGGGAGLESWTSFTSVVSQQRSYGHCVCDSVPHSSWDSKNAQWRAGPALKFLLFWRSSVVLLLLLLQMLLYVHRGHDY